MQPFGRLNRIINVIPGRTKKKDGMEMKILFSKKGSRVWRSVAVLMAALIAVASLNGCAILNAAFPQSPGGNSNSNYDVKSSGGSRTIMIYIVGSDLESGGGLATFNIAQMIDSDVDLENNHILIQTGGTKKWQNNVIPNDKCVVYELMEDGIEPVKEEPSKNLATPESLTDFMSYCYDNYKTDSYSLILWDHGGGPLGGYGIDEVYGEIMSLGQLCEAFDNSPFGNDNKLEWLGFDACLMGSLEIAVAFQGYANYLISSQEVEPGWGWDYSFLSEINPSMTTEQLAAQLIDHFMAFYDDRFEKHPREYSDITLSCMDLRKIPDVTDKLGALYGKAQDSLDKSSFPSASRIRGKTKEFGVMGTDSSFELIDLKHLTTQMAKDFPEADDLIKALDELVVYNKTNTKNANGVSIFYPYNMKVKMDKLDEFYKSIHFSDDYMGYIKKFAGLQNDSSTTNWDLSKSKAAVAGDVDDADGMTFSMQLTPEQVENYARSNYMILMKIKDEKAEAKNEEPGYAVIYHCKDVKLDDSGKLQASFNGKVPKLRDTKTGNVGLCTIMEKERTDEYVRYHTPFIVRDIYGPIDEYKSDSGMLQLQSDVDGSNAEILSAVPFSDDNSNDFSIAPKQLIDIYDYELVWFVYSGRVPTRDSNGNMKPWVDWDKTGNFYMWELILDQENQDSFEFFMEDINKVTNAQDGKYESDEFIVMFNVTDVQGNIYASEMIPVKF